MPFCIDCAESLKEGYNGDNENRIIVTTDLAGKVQNVPWDDLESLQALKVQIIQKLALWNDMKMKKHDMKQHEETFRVTGKGGKEYIQCTLSQWEEKDGFHKVTYLSTSDLGTTRGGVYLVLPQWASEWIKPVPSSVRQYDITAPAAGQKPIHTDLIGNLKYCLYYPDKRYYMVMDSKGNKYFVAYTYTNRRRASGGSSTYLLGWGTEMEEPKSVKKPWEVFKAKLCSKEQKNTPPLSVGGVGRWVTFWHHVDEYPDTKYQWCPSTQEPREAPPADAEQMPKEVLKNTLVWKNINPNTEDNTGGITVV